MTRKAITGARIFDGADWHDRMALIVGVDGRVEGLAAADSPIDAERVAANGSLLVPGFIDLQVNGGGGVQFNQQPDLAAIETICTTHAQFGTTALLPTLVTDVPEINMRAMAAGVAATEKAVPGFLGLHLEGPHLAVSRKGAHSPELIRPMNATDEERLIAARITLPNLIVTVAAETVGPEQISRLTAAGIVVSIGHSDGSYAQVSAAASAGASMVTHLFNAQSQVGNREPGVVGAALDLGAISAGLIADGIHVHPVSIGLALRSKRGPGQIFLVTDAMALTGSPDQSFELTGRTVYRSNGALRLADGTLAGADLKMIDAITYMHRIVGVPLDEALRMASLYPAAALGVSAERGHLNKGARADFVVLSDNLAVASTWIGGQQVFG